MAPWLESSMPKLPKLKLSREIGTARSRKSNLATGKTRSLALHGAPWISTSPTVKPKTSLVAPARKRARRESV